MQEHIAPGPGPPAPPARPAASALTAVPAAASQAPPAASLPFAIKPDMMQNLPALSRAFAAKMGSAAAPPAGSPGVAAAAGAVPPALAQDHSAMAASQPAGHAPAPVSALGPLPPVRKAPTQPLPPLPQQPHSLAAQRPPPVSVEHSEMSVAAAGACGAGTAHDDPLSPQSHPLSQYAGSVTSPNSDAAAMAEKWVVSTVKAMHHACCLQSLLALATTHTHLCTCQPCLTAAQHATPMRAPCMLPDACARACCVARACAGLRATASG
jgi:hypothetical protein